MMDELFQQLFNDAYNEAHERFCLRKIEDPSFSKAFLQGFLDSQYVSQGNNWEGRSQVKEIMQDAVIAAAEAVLAEWDA